MLVCNISIEPLLRFGKNSVVVDQCTSPSSHCPVDDNFGEWVECIGVTSGCG